MNGLIVFSNLAAACVRSLACLFLISRLLSAKEPGKRGISVVLAGAASISAVCSAAGLAEFPRILLETALIVACARYFQGADARMSLFVGSFYEMAVSLWQFLFAAWLGVVFCAPDFLNAGTGNGQIAVWCLHLLLILLLGCLLKGSEMEGQKAFRLASGIVLAGFLAVVSLSEQTVLAIDGDTLDMWTILAVVLMMAVLVFRINRQYEAEKELARLKSQQAELLERDYTTLNQAYAINARLFHDLHNHIGVLRRLLSHGKTEEAARYLNELQAPVREMTDSVWTGDETADYLINSKAAVAEESGIQYQAEVEFPRHTNLGSADLCAILGNLLDNALDAARQVPKPEQRFVRLTIRRINQMLIIKVENSFLTQPVRQEGELKTTKEEGGLHGWGLKSAQIAAEKYDGMVRTSYDGHVFRAVATLSYQGVERE